MTYYEIKQRLQFGLMSTEEAQKELDNLNLGSDTNTYYIKDGQVKMAVG